jgi:hypothetical protein
VLYLLCRLRGLPTMMLDMSSLPGRLLLMEDLEEGCASLARCYQDKLKRFDGAPVGLTPYAEAYWERLRQTYDGALPMYMRIHMEKQARRAAAASWKSRLAKAANPLLLWNEVKAARDFLLAPPPPNYIKVKGKRMQESFISGLGWRLYRRRRARIKRELAAHYETLVQEADLAQPFVFVPLHYQPEKTTSPQGGLYTHQMLMMEVLAASLPPGWWIYAKEAPAQFMPHLRETAAKNKAFYRRLAALPRVKLVSMELSSFDLIDHGRAVATVTGTAGWEAALRGKPALVFAHAWYRGCEGVSYTPTWDECKRTLAEVAEGRRAVDPQKVRLYLQALEEVGVWGYVEEHAARASGITPQENAASLAAAVHGFYGELRG